MEILSALLDDAGYEGFTESEEGLTAYIQEVHKDESRLKEILRNLKEHGVSGEYTVALIPETNWNAIWERDFEPVSVGREVYIRAHFHPANPHCTFDLIITPKMSFGTGHHQTTRLMIRALLESDPAGKTILDLGTGTGVLAILAAKMGAEKIVATDIDENACENARENAIANDCSQVEVLHRKASELENGNYDLLLANINRNVLLEEIPLYAGMLTKGGRIILSGFLEQDLEVMKEAIESAGLQMFKIYRDERWLAVSCIG